MITDEMVELAIAAGTPEVSATRGYIYEEFDLRAALAAVLPLIRNAALDEAAKLCAERVSRLKELVKEAFEEAARRYPNQAEAQIAFIQGALSWGVPTAEDMSWASDAIRKHEQETPND
jgi:hypothetical protein